MGLLKRTLGGAALIVGVVLAPAVESAYAMPGNDVPGNATWIFIRDSSLLGVRLPAERVRAHGTFINPEMPLFPPINDNLDPPLIQPVTVGGLQTSSPCFDRFVNSTDPNIYASRTVWYELRQDENGAPIGQRSLVTIDSAGTTFGSSLQVFEGTVPSFVRGSSPLPKNNVACDMTVPSGGATPAASVSFVTKRNTRYFIEAGVSPNVSAGSASLRLSVRMLDIDPPAVTVRADNAAQDASKVFTYELSRDEQTAGLSALSAVQIRGGKRTPLTPLKVPATASSCNEARLKKLPGRYCRAGLQVFVHWLPIHPPSVDFGQVSASFTDLAKNIGRNSIQTELRDTTPPLILGTPRVKWTRRGRLNVSARCIRGPGAIRVEVTAGGPPVRAGQTRFGRRTMVLKRTFNNVRRRALFVHIICFDRSRNSNDRWLFLPR